MEAPGAVGPRDRREFASSLDYPARRAGAARHLRLPDGARAARRRKDARVGAAREPVFPAVRLPPALLRGGGAWRRGTPFPLRPAPPPLSSAEGRRVAGLERIGKRIVFVLEGAGAGAGDLF